MYLEFDKTQGSSYGRFLITPKLFVFFYSASLGCLLPFLPVFFRLNGLTAVQNGFLIAARYLILFWAAPLFSFIASKLNSRKLVLVSAVLFGAVINTSFLFTAEYENHYRENCFPNKNTTRVTPANITVVSTVSSNEFYYPSHFSYEKIKCNSRSINHPDANENNTTGYYQSFLVFKTKIERHVCKTIGLKFDEKFVFFLIIMCVGTLLSSPAKPLHELVTLAIVKEFKGSYNVQRLSSCTGWSVMALVTALVVYLLPCGFHLSQNAFDLHFCFHVLFSTTALIFAALMKSPNQKATTKFKFWRVLKITCKNPNVIVVIISMAVLGTAQSINSSYLFWYVLDLGGHELHLGLIVLISGLSQIPLLYGTKYLIHWLGHGWVIFLSLFVFGGRFLLYSFCDHPLTILPIELLNSLTSSSIWLTSMSMAVVVAPIGLERSMQNLFTASYYGLGMGFGGILTSIAYQLYGPVSVFRYAAGMCAVYSVVMAFLQCLISPPDENQGIPINGDYYKAGVNANNQSDWLLEALNADEEEVHYAR